MLLRYVEARSNNLLQKKLVIVVSIPLGIIQRIKKKALQVCITCKDLRKETFTAEETASER